MANAKDSPPPLPVAGLQRANQILEKFSSRATAWAGSSWAFATAAGLLVLWLISGPFLGFSEMWQLLVNTCTTIATFLMVFLLQRAQNKESRSIQIKLNELLASQQGASNKLINVEDLSEEEIRGLHKRFASLATQLEGAQDQCDPHSVNEAAEALEEAQQTLGGARRAG